MRKVPIRNSEQQKQEERHNTKELAIIDKGAGGEVDIELDHQNFPNARPNDGHKIFLRLAREAEDCN